MAVTISYPRPKSTTTNTTAIALTVRAAETPGNLIALGGGNTGEVQAMWRADANETGATLIKDYMQFLITPALDPTTHTVVFTVVATPVHGDGTFGPPRTFHAGHDESMDSWQTGAGRVRQP